MKFNLKEIWSIIDIKEKRKIISVTIAQAFSGLIDMIGVISILPFLSLLTDPDIINKNGYLKKISVFLDLTYNESLLFFGIMSFLIIFFNQFTRIFTNWYASFVSHSLWLNLTQKMFYYFLNQDYNYYLKNNTYSLLEKISQQVNAAQSGVIEPLFKLLSHIFTSLFIFATLFYLEPSLTLLGIFFIFLIFLFFFKLLRPKLEKLGKMETETSKKLINLYGDSFNAIKEIKILHNEEYYRNIFLPLGQKHIDIQVKRRLMIDFPNGLAEIFSFGIIIALTLFLIFTATGFSKIVGTLALFGFGLKRIIPAANGIFQQISNIQFYQASFERVKNELIDATIKNKKYEDEKEFKKMVFKNSIQIKDATFNYENYKKPSIEEINLTINKGQFVGITGSTGSGKSTLIDILLGLIELKDGSILIDNEKLTSRSIKKWHSIVGYVDQTGYLSDNSIKNNIAFGIDESNIDLENIKRSAKLAKISDFIEKDLPNSYETFIGERGVRLSGGQRQRIRIARAIYRKPQILILDEATSALDSNTEKEVINSLKYINKDLTVIMITHRTSTLKNCDNIFYLKNGKIVEEGKLEKLLEKNLKLNY